MSHLGGTVQRMVVGYVDALGAPGHDRVSFARRINGLRQQIEELTEHLFELRQGDLPPALRVVDDNHTPDGATLPNPARAVDNTALRVRTLRYLNAMQAELSQMMTEVLDLREADFVAVRPAPLASSAETRPT